MKPLTTFNRGAQSALMAGFNETYYAGNITLEDQDYSLLRVFDSSARVRGMGSHRTNSGIDIERVKGEGSRWENPGGQAGSSNSKVCVCVWVGVVYSNSQNDWMGGDGQAMVDDRIPAPHSLGTACCGILTVCCAAVRNRRHVPCRRACRALRTSSTARDTRWCCAPR
jgi:hypothetical protein